MKLSRKLGMGSGIGAILMAAVLIGSGGQPAPTAAMRIAPRHHPMRVHLQHEDGNYTSYNWAGYAVTGANGAVTDVKASWVIPAVTCTTNTNGYSSFWVGIDGWNSSTVEQIGTDSDCVSLSGKTGVPTYYAWFEFYPHPGYLIQFPAAIQPSHIITAEVTALATSSSGGPGPGGPGGRFAQVAGTQFTATITDKTTGYTFTTTTSVSGAQQSSAEWIAEAPCCGSGGNVLPLAPFGAADFGHSYTGAANTAYATVNKTPGAIGSFGTNVQTSTMVGEHNASLLKASPSPLSDNGASFQVAWHNPGP